MHRKNLRNRRNNCNSNDNGNGINIIVPKALISIEFSGTGKIGNTLILILALFTVLGFSADRYWGLENYLRDYKHVENVTQISEGVRFVEEIYPERISYFIDDLNKNCSAADTVRTNTFSNPLTNSKRVSKFVY